MSKLKKILVLFYSLYFCIRVFPLRIAVKIPIKLSTNIKLGNLYKGAVEIQSSNIKRGMITIGLTGSEALQYSNGFITIKKGGKILFKGTAYFGAGSSIRVDEAAVLTIGSLFGCNKNLFLRCNKKVNIGENVHIGWNCTINDCDGHTFIEQGIAKPNRGNIEIGNHVWIGMGCTILKNTIIANDCVISARSLLSKKYLTANCLIAGIPAEIKKNNISWKL